MVNYERNERTYSQEIVKISVCECIAHILVRVWHKQNNISLTM